jgi:hypothetical protein
MPFSFLNISYFSKHCLIFRAIRLKSVLCISLLAYSFRGESVLQGQESPWGDFDVVPIFLEAPNDLVETFPLPNPTVRWSFPIETADQLPGMFSVLDLPQSMVAVLSLPSAQIRSGQWIHLFPPAYEVENLNPSVRSRLYAQLSRYAINEFHENPVLILTDSIDDWYASSSIRKEVVEAIKKLAYKRGDAWAVSDLPLILRLAESEKEARQIFKVFTRTRTYLVKIKIEDSLDIDMVRNYWSIAGKSFRLKSLEPLLASIQESGRETELDIAHLIPALPRKLIYNYPGASYVVKGTMPDCHWTSLNFFNYEPHEYLLDPVFATNRVLEGYTPVDPPYKYGDILFYVRESDGDAFHSCIYLADQYVFTKNGRN